MTTPPDRPATSEALFLWVMHRFAEVFEDHAILKGGMALRLLDCPRSTTDIDYVFVPYTSKKDVLEPIRQILEELPDVRVEIHLHSKMLRAAVQVDDAAIQVEVNVAEGCEAIPMATGGFAHGLGRPSQVVRVMALDVALAHKLAAWNERRLVRDLYDVYFLAVRLGERPDPATLDSRLATFASRLPALHRRRSMSRGELAAGLRAAAAALDRKDLDEELGPLLPPEELAGLLPRLRGAMSAVADQVEG